MGRVIKALFSFLLIFRFFNQETLVKETGDEADFFRKEHFENFYMR